MGRGNKDFQDDGRTIASMENVPASSEFGWRRMFFPPTDRRLPRIKEKREPVSEANASPEPLNLTKGEKRAIRKAALIVGLQVGAIGVGMLVIIYILMRLWIGW